MNAMQQPPADSLTVALTLSLAAASIVTWFYLFSRLAQRRHILSYEPRQPVPWGPPAALLAVLFVLVALSSVIGSPETPPKDASPFQTSERILGPMLIELVVIATALTLVIAFTKPKLQDLGLPAHVDELVRDVATGMVGCLAAIVPVYGVLILMRYMEGQFDESHHPLIELVMKTPDFGVMLSASVAAVIAAPICEEIAFRLLLQGWLEKWEDELLGWREEESVDEARMTNDECRMTNEGQANCDDSSFVIRHSSFSPGAPPRRGVFGLPYGWLPIVTSSFLFALAHFGYGPEPMPLFVLALILGYIYQRTHCIVPCIVMHALFNLVTVVTLWRMISLSSE